MNAAEKKQLNQYATEAMRAIVANNEVLDGIASESKKDSDVYSNVVKEAFNLAEAMMSESIKR